MGSYKLYRRQNFTISRDPNTNVFMWDCIKENIFLFDYDVVYIPFIDQGIKLVGFS